MKLTPEDLDKLRTKEIANAIRKLYAGKTLTSAERALLAQQSIGGSDTAAGGFAATWDALAQRLGTTRRSLQEWRKDPRYKADSPRPQADGRLDVAAFAAWMLKHGLNRADERVGDSPIAADDEHDEDDPIIHPPRLAGSQADWKKAEIRLGVERRQIEIDTLRGTLIVAADLEIPLGATFAAIQTKLAQFPARAARYLVGLRDIAEVEERLRDEIDADLADLHAARFTAEDAIATAVAAVPFDAATTALCEKLIFAGADRTALLDLAAAIAGEALRQLGRTAVQHAQHSAETPDTAIADALTGQVTDEAAAREASARATVELPPSTEKPPAKRPAGKSRKGKSPALPGSPAPAAAQGIRDTRKKARAKTVTGPAASEAMIAPSPRRKRKPRR